MNLPYCAKLVYDHDRDRFLHSLFVPERQRAALHALLALNVELMQVRQHISEEMIGHIRYAWWYEKTEALFDGQATHGHPVFEALAPLIAQNLLPKPQTMALVETYRAHFPDAPHDAGERLHQLGLHLLKHVSPEAENRWLKAHHAIQAHRQRHPHGKNAKLAFKLLFLK